MSRNSKSLYTDIRAQSYKSNEDIKKNNSSKQLVPKHNLNNFRNSVDDSGNKNKEKSEFHRLYTFGKNGESIPKSSERVDIVVPI